jgi:hypothetical protein
VPSDWRRWRAQWEFGHAGHFVVTFAGFLALLGATVRVSALTGVSLAGRGASSASVPHVTSLEGTAAGEGVPAPRPNGQVRTDLKEPSLTARPWPEPGLITGIPWR